MTCFKKTAIFIGLLIGQICLKVFFTIFCKFWVWLYLFQVIFNFRSSNFTLQRNCEISFVALCFYLNQLKNFVSDFWNSISNRRYYYFCRRCRLCPTISNRHALVEKLLMFNGQSIKGKFYCWQIMETYKIARLEKRRCYCW